MHRLLTRRKLVAASYKTRAVTTCSVGLRWMLTVFIRVQRSRAGRCARGSDSASVDFVRHALVRGGDGARLRYVQPSQQTEEHEADAGRLLEGNEIYLSYGIKTASTMFRYYVCLASTWKRKTPHVNRAASKSAAWRTSWSSQSAAGSRIASSCLIVAYSILGLSGWQERPGRGVQTYPHLDDGIVIGHRAEVTGVALLGRVVAA